MCAKLCIDEPDFHAEFDQKLNERTALWQQAEINVPTKYQNCKMEYTISAKFMSVYEKELQKQNKNGWLIPYDEQEFGPPKGLIGLMAIVKQNKSKLCPMLDNWEVNQHINIFTVDAEVN